MSSIVRRIPNSIKKSTPTWWWTSREGKNFVAGTFVFGATAAFCAVYIPEYFYAEEYVDFIHLYRSGIKVDVTEEVKRLVDKCGDLLGFNEEQKTYIKPFTVFGFDLYTIGTMKSRYFANIGIPEHFYYKSELDIRKDDIEINGKAVDWLSKAGESFSDSLVLTEGEKKFALCREIMMAEGNKPLIDSLYPALTTLGAYNLGRTINTKYNFYDLHLSVRLTLYSLISAFSVGVYFLLKDSMQWYYESDTDKRLSKLGPQVVNDGVAFYKKLLERNKALRTLMGENGKMLYTSVGNEYSFFRTPHLPITDRLQYFESKLQEKTEEK